MAYEDVTICYLIFGIIFLIAYIILFFAILEMRNNTREIKKLLYFNNKWNIDKDSTNWKEHRGKYEWDEFKKPADIKNGEGICKQCGTKNEGNPTYCATCGYKLLD